MASAMEGALVYVPHKDDLWRPAQVLEVLADHRVRVEVRGWEPDGGPPKELECKLAAPATAFPLVNVNMPAAGTPQMTSLNHLHEAAILDNLRRRFAAGLPYTYTGDIVIAVNPYVWRRRHKRIHRQGGAAVTTALPPHFSHCYSLTRSLTPFLSFFLSGTAGSMGCTRWTSGGST